MPKLTGSLALLLLFFACFGAAGEARADTIVDPTGDTFGTDVQHDITSINASFDSSTITFTVNFAGQIYAPSAMNERSVFGYIDLDTDRNPATGEEPEINLAGFGPDIQLGDEFLIDLFSEESQVGEVDVFDQEFDVVGRAPVSFNATSFSVIVPLALLGGSNGLMNYGVIVGTFLNATDRAPNGAEPATSAPVPEPTTMLLLVTGLSGIMLHARRHRGNR